MIRTLSAIVFLILSFSSSNAQPIEVRSGQHEGFVRLIVDLPSRLQPSIENGRDEASISFASSSLEFDVSKIFNRIARDDVSNVVPDLENNGLRIEFGCACEVSSFWFGESLLVLDIAPRTVPLPLTETVAEQPNREVFSPPSQPIVFPQGSQSLAASLARPNLTPSENAPRVQMEAEDAVNNAERDAIEELVREARDQLTQQIGRAASQGLLSPRRTIKKIEEKQETKETVEIAGPETSRGVLNNVNLHAQSSIDRDFLSALQGTSTNQFQPVCLNDSEISVASWGDDSGYSEQVGLLRKSLMGEFDHLDTNAALTLARLQLHFGFGVEAKSTLSLIEGELETKSILVSLAEIMENGFARTFSVLSNQLNCHGPAALWAILSHERLPQDLPINKDAAILAFDALPQHLRNHLGPILSRRFLDAGDNDAAENILRILRRSNSTTAPSANLVNAEISRSEGEYETAIVQLEDVVQADAEPSAKALISLIDTSLQTGGPVSFEYAILAGAYVQQYRDDPMEKDLVRVYLSGLAAAGAFDQANEERERLIGKLSPTELLSIDNEILRQIVENADDVTFLKHVFSPSLDLPNRAAPKVGNATANRLLEAGFPQHAGNFLLQNADGKAGQERQILRAKLALREGNPDQVETALLNIESSEAEKLRAEARARSGDHEGAAQLFSLLGLTDEALRQSWLGEDWENLKGSEDSVLSNSAALAALASSDSAETLDERTHGILSLNRSLLQQSSAARGTINEVLMANPSPPADARNP